MPTVCQGCHRQFTPSGYLSHLLQTKQARCIHVREDHEARGLFALQETVVDDGDDEDEADEQPAAPQAFEGDYFGDYGPADFDDFDNYQQADDGDEEADEEDLDDRAGDDNDDDNDDYQDAQNYEDEQAWEPPPSSPPRQSPPPLPADPLARADDSQGAQADTDRVQQERARRHLQQHRTFCVNFPGTTAGKPLSDARVPTEYESFKTTTTGANSNPYAPFTSKVDWEFARWAKMRGPGSTAVTELLSIEEIPQLLGLSFKNSAQLNAIIDDTLISGRPRFTRREIIVAGEVFEVFYRDIIACVQALFGDPEFAGILVFTPERHYADADHTARVYFDMHTGQWWWAQQRAMEQRKPGATLIPIIISSDKTQLTLFGSKAAYPVYMTIGNLPKDVRRKPSRRGQILLAYLPTSNLSHITSPPARRRALTNLYHACMSRVMKPLRKAGVDGIPLASGDGIRRRGHPIFAMHVGDYPEQVLVVGCKTGECPKCPILAEDIGKTTDCDRPLRDFKKVLAALQTINAGPRAFSCACREAGIKRIQDPYWAHLPFVNIYQAITPDILHQLCQGVVKHIFAWLIAAYGAEEIDARCRRFPPNHNIHLFLKGISKLQRVTGKEHADMCRFVLGLVIGVPLPDGCSSSQLVRAVHALLDFLYLAQYPAHTTDTLELLEHALQRFHANKSVFVDLGIRTNFKIPKLHSLDHYVQCIILFGTTDNYDTQYTEQLHIDFAKDAYRATNRKDEFPQMTLWLERREKILRHGSYIQWRLRNPTTRGSTQQALAPRRMPPADNPLAANDSEILSRIRLTRFASVKAVRFATASQRYGATYLQDALARFVVRYRDPQATTAQVEQAAIGVYIRRHWTMPVWHKIRFALEDAQDLGVMEDAQDVAHARPERRDSQGRYVPGRFDTVLVREATPNGDRLTGPKRYRIGRIRMLFKLRKTTTDELFPAIVPPSHLAYVEWFTALTDPDPIHGLYRVARCRGAAGERLADIVEVSSIVRSCHLLPCFGASAPREWTSSNVLDSCDNFLLNTFSDQHMYMSIV